MANRRAATPQENVIVGILAPVLATGVVYALSWAIAWVCSTANRPEVLLAFMAAWGATSDRPEPPAEEATRMYLFQWGMYLVYVYHIFVLTSPVAAL